MMKESQFNPQIAVASILGVALVACCMIAAQCVVRIKGSREIIRVTGSAHKAVHSDFIIWKGQITDRAATRAEAYRRIKIHADKMHTYLLSKGIPASDIFPLAIDTQVIHKGYYYHDDISEAIVAYELTQGIEIRSRAVDLVDRVSRESTEMMSRGIPIESGKSQYIYSQLGDLKLTMLAEASRDAYNRADRIARYSKSRVGDLRYARMGVIQIEGLYDSEGVTDTGANDTASLYKKATAVVTAEFAIR